MFLDVFLLLEEKKGKLDLCCSIINPRFVQLFGDFTGFFSELHSQIKTLGGSCSALEMV